MKRLIRNRRAGRVCGADGTRDMDDIQLARAMRSLAVELTATDWARLKPERRAAARLQGALEKAAEIDARCEAGGAALKRLVQDGRLMEACARQAMSEAGMNLPASGKKPRLLSVMERMIVCGGFEVTQERLVQCVAAFDDVQALTMPELWAVPCALRIVIAEKLADTVESALEIAADRLAAEQWTQRPSGRRLQESPAFFEHALHMAGETEQAEAMEKLCEALRRMGTDGEAMIRRAHEDQARQLMMLDRLLACKRLLDGMNWQECFERLSRVDAELRYDPGHIYGGMDDESRAEVRRQVTLIARKLHLAELTIARHAVNAAVESAQDGNERRGTVCWWLMTDEGLRMLASRMGVDGGVLPKRVPDPTGRMCVRAIAALAAVFAGLWLLWCDSVWLILPGILLTWRAANAVTGRVYARMFPPTSLLSMEVRQVPDEWRTLVVMPVLLSSEERAREMCRQMEAAGCLESDRNIRFLLLGDFADGSEAENPDDGAILDAARSGIKAMNDRAGWEKYGYIHRRRSYLKADGRWMGHDRKRGALMALNRVLLDMPGAAEAFAAENGACAWLREGFRFVVTLDADTRFIPGTVRRLIGTLAHPLNRRREGVGYGILQPCMEMLPSACVNEFVRLFAGSGGLNTYPVSVSNLWQDLTGEGMFQGKGIYDVRAFYDALEGALPEGRILSHDLIEGALAGTGFAGNITFYDGYPPKLSAVMKRLNRWTRGDWQLLPFIFSRKTLPGGRRLTLPQRLRMADNLIRSLHAPSLLAILLLSVWLGSSNGLAAGVIAAYLEPILHIGNGDGLKWRRATAELAILPLTAWHMCDAILRTLWRLGVSGRHMLDWVTAADSENLRENTALPGRVAAILLIPGLIAGGWAGAAVALAALFLVGPGWIRDMERDPGDGEGALTGEQVAVLNGLARDTWRFFEKYVPMDGRGLPPDNVQIDPPAGIAKRTSPTNIGLYLLSCISACRLGFIREDEMRARMDAAMDSMARMDKWKGHLYNWYDTDSLQPLRPRYVSSVDSGNLAACLLLAASAVENSDEALARRMRKMAADMDLAALYDEKRKLFSIGIDCENGAVSTSFYDLLASESRILSYTAMMLGKVDVRHWEKLSRTAVNTGSGCALASWSGTLFEYLMPELFMRAPAHSLIGRSNRAVVKAQKALGAAKKRPWGVSESGYFAFDMHLNYQYRAFGLKSLALSGSASENVVAPYACLLALPYDPAGVAENVRFMGRLGWADECGLYEAADYLRKRPDGRPGIVKSHMAHHQGMILCALCNALGGEYLVNCFMNIPEARALDLLLQEKPAARVRLKAAEAATAVHARPVSSASRTTRPGKRLADVHVISGERATAVISQDGSVHYMKNGLWATRFSGSLTDRRDGACLHVRDRDSGADCVPGQGGRMRFEPGWAVVWDELDGVDILMNICISPEDGTLYRDVLLENHRETAANITVADVLPAALAPAADLCAHSVFRHLFMESSPLGQKGVVFRRRPRDREEACMQMVHMTSEPDAAFETDHEKLTGRMGDTLRPGGIGYPFTGSFGAVLDPVSAISADITIEPGASRRMHFAMNLIDSDDDGEIWMEDVLPDTAPRRAMQLALARAKAMMDYTGVDERAFRLMQPMAALMLDGHLAAYLRDDHRPVNGTPRNLLWETGVSGDLPILMMRAEDPGQGANVRQMIRCHEFYRAMGMDSDLVFLCDQAGYAQPVRDMLAEHIAASHLRDRQSCPGGVWILDRKLLSEGAYQALCRAAAVTFSGNRDLSEQIRGLLAGLEMGERPVPAKLDPGENRLQPMDAELYNGYGGFTGGGYAIDVLPDRTTPAPWCNILAGEKAGMLVTERGGGFFWHGNSRSGRLTPFVNDRLREGWGVMLYLVETKTGAFVKLLPGYAPDMVFRVFYDGARSEYRFDTEKIRGCAAFCVSGGQDGVRLRLDVEHRQHDPGDYRLIAFVNWQMGADAADDGWITAWNDGSACYASGTATGVGFFASDAPDARPGPGRIAFLGRGGIERPEGLNAPADAGGWTIAVPDMFGNGSTRRIEFALGWGADVQDAREQVRRFYGRRGDAFENARKDWEAMKASLVIETPDLALNHIANECLIRQTMASRIMGRTGFYQPGGAYGFRDQLQDMLAILHFDPERVRRHILRCAAHQFEDGDVMHWWHEPAHGVRTRISDDMLFLPWVTAAYVKHTGDSAILGEMIPYLENVPIPEGKEDVFTHMRTGSVAQTLHRHCMRAFRRASATGVHGLALMGSGDWNDGMNRVGARGRGESVWLSQFIIACAEAYREIVTDGKDRAFLADLAGGMTAAVEEAGWDGSWYLRAYTDDGQKLGSASGSVCRIDAISQAWAVIAGLNPARCALAMDSAWEMLVDRNIGIIRLLTPPFDGGDTDPGYIRGYPAGVRENGAQYTHGACWLLLAMIRMGREQVAHEMLNMLLPTSHSHSPESAAVYRVEPYVLAADICSEPPHRGQGGWTWYTGAAAWLYTCILALLGYERRGSDVRIAPMLGEWNEVSVTLRFGNAAYRLSSNRHCTQITLDGDPIDTAFITLQDDGKSHEAVFPPAAEQSDAVGTCLRALPLGIPPKGH